jgi:hypothetical protein
VDLTWEESCRLSLRLLLGEMAGKSADARSVTKDLEVLGTVLVATHMDVGDDVQLIEARGMLCSRLNLLAIIKEYGYPLCKSGARIRSNREVGVSAYR